MKVTHFREAPPKNVSQTENAVLSIESRDTSSQEYNGLAEAVYPFTPFVWKEESVREIYRCMASFSVHRNCRCLIESIKDNIFFIVF